MTALDLEQPAPRAMLAVRVPKIAARSRLWVALVTIVAITAVVLAALPKRVTVVHPVSMSLRDDAAGTGFVRAKVVAGVGSRVNGVIVATYVDQGDVVRAGQVVAELQNGDVQGQVRQATHQLDAQRASVLTSRANVAAAEARLRAGASALDKAKAVLRLAELTLQRTRKLHESGIASQEALDAADAAAARDVDTAEALRAASAQQLAAAESDARTAATLADVSAAGVDVQRANLAYTVVRSPFDGYVVTRELERGATVVPGLPIFTVADPSVMWVSANIDEREAGGLRAGQRAAITLRSSPGRKFPGTVARIAQQADPVTEDVTVDVAFARPAEVTLNETAEVEIVKQIKPGALAVPATAIVRARQGPALWIVEHGRLQLRTVETGIRDKGGWIEIVRGAAASDFVLVNPSTESVALSPGGRVRTRQTVIP